MEKSKKIRQPTRYEMLAAEIEASGLRPPQTITLMVTNGCNLACRHCWLDCQPLEGAKPVRADRITTLIDGFTQMGVATVNLTGGEILSHPDWRRILNFCSHHGRIKNIGLQTNATMLGRKEIEILLASPPDKLTIQVSLDGAHARTHNLVRGPGSYAHAMAGLRLLVEAGLGDQTQVAFTEMAHNIGELPELLELVDNMGIGHLVSGTLVRGGRAAVAPHIALPSPSQYWELIDFYNNDSIFHTLYEKKSKIAAIEWFKNRSETAPAGCSCLKNLFVNASGTLYPCTMLQLERYAVKNVYARSLKESIGEGLAKWRGIPEVSRDRPRMISSCQRCAYKKHCGGGCMGRAAAAGGELLVPEDRCSLRKAVYTWTKLPSVGSYCRRG